MEESREGSGEILKHSTQRQQESKGAKKINFAVLFLPLQSWREKTSEPE